jgi:hypothetical protein
MWVHATEIRGVATPTSVLVTTTRAHNMRTWLHARMTGHPHVSVKAVMMMMIMNQQAHTSHPHSKHVT